MTKKHDTNVTYGPHNPHPLSTRRTELIWEGKYDEYGNRRDLDVAGLAMPMQRIETIDQPRSEAAARGQLALFEKKNTRLDDFRNRLIWGDNKLVMASLLRDFKGKVDLVYIDPPFDVGADFTATVDLGQTGESVSKDQSALEMVAYRDTWGRDADSYLQMLFERILFVRDLLSERGSLFVHIGPNIAHAVRALCLDILGTASFRNEIVWQRHDPHNDARKQLGCITDRILWFARSAKPYYDPDARRDELSAAGVKEFSLYELPDGSVVPWVAGETRLGRRFKLDDATWKGTTRRFSWRGATPSPKREWMYDLAGLEAALERGELYLRDPKKGAARCRKRYLDQNEGIYLQDLWTNVGRMKGGSDYPTEKPLPLLEQIVAIASPPDALVADFFSGSGTTAVAAERLGRRWLMADLGRFAIHTSRKRLIELQRELHNEGKPYRAFDVYNLGRYERQWWQKDSLKGADEEHRRIVLEFFRAEILEPSRTPSPLIHGRKGFALCHVDSIDSVFTRDEAKQVACAASQAGARECYCLAWEFEMDLRLTTAALEKELGVALKLIQIPREIMEKNRKSPPPFLGVAVLEAEAIIRTPTQKGDMPPVDIKLTKFLPSLAEVPSKELEAIKERAMTSGFDFIDFWAIDFDWHSDRPFNHHWQDYRTRKDRSLKTVSDAGFVYPKKGTYTSCIKVVDTFGCDTSVTVEVRV